MIGDIERLVHSYLDWLREKTVLKQIDDWVQITTPHLDRHNDALQIYAGKVDGGYRLTDDSYTLEDLATAGCLLDTPKRKQLLQMTLNGFGVQRVGDALEVRATESNFAAKKHDLIQAMLAVNDLFYLAAPTVESIFYEDVMKWLDQIEVRYSPNIRFVGKSGYEHAVDFVIPKSVTQPERFVETVTRPSKQTAQNVVFKLNDIREARQFENRMYVFLNDQYQEPVSPDVMDAFRSYELRPVLWAEREQVRQELAA
ncbi:MAG: DUF1829 domain-containing protein [Fimbriimonadales bacterium]|nr:DUF1829 domain-containing protein [Fimbriimonadales bacterium]